MYLSFLVITILGFVLLSSISFFVRLEDNTFKIGILLFRKEIPFKKRKNNSFQKIMKDISLFRSMLSKSKVSMLDITTYTKINGDILEPFYYTFLMTSVNSIRNAIDYYSYGIKEEKYNNVIILEGKNKINFKCIFSIKIVNIIIAVIKWIGDLYGKSSRRNA